MARTVMISVIKIIKYIMLGVLSAVCVELRQDLL
jgi:hypothetical protein